MKWRPFIIGFAVAGVWRVVSEHIGIRPWVTWDFWYGMAMLAVVVAMYETERRP